MFGLDDFNYQKPETTAFLVGSKASHGKEQKKVSTTLGTGSSCSRKLHQGESIRAGQFLLEKSGTVFLRELEIFPMVISLTSRGRMNGRHVFSTSCVCTHIFLQIGLFPALVRITLGGRACIFWQKADSGGMSLYNCLEEGCAQGWVSLLIYNEL